MQISWSFLRFAKANWSDIFHGEKKGNKNGGVCVWGGHEWQLSNSFQSYSYVLVMFTRLFSRIVYNVNISIVINQGK